MGLERRYQILVELCSNPYRSAKTILSNISKQKAQHPAERGGMSETMIQFLIGGLQGVEKVGPFHQFLCGFDCDLKVEITRIEPVYIQVKTTEKYMKSVKRKLERYKKKEGKCLRIVSLSSEVDFDEIIADFTDQVNAIEGRRILTPVKFTQEKPRKRKSYSS